MDGQRHWRNEKFYIASRLENVDEVRRLGQMLTRAGWIWTYDWTRHGSVRGNAERLREVAAMEARGVMDSDLVIVLLPGGKGTHTELGMALAAGKEVILNDATGEAFASGEGTCSFYHHHAVTQTCLTAEQLAIFLAARRFTYLLATDFQRGGEQLLWYIKAALTGRWSDGT